MKKKDTSMIKEYYRPLAIAGGSILLVLILFATCCTVVDSGEVGIRFHKWSLNEQDYGGVEGTCKGWVFYNPITTNVFTYPTFTQRKQYETFSVNAKDASFSRWTQRLPIASTPIRPAISLRSIVWE